MSEALKTLKNTGSTTFSERRRKPSSTPY